MSKLDASTSLPNSANNKRQADARFKRAEFDLKQKCLLNGVEYEGPSPTESTNETKVRRALIRRKIDRINEDVHQPAVPKRQRNRRFQRHENYIKRACEIEGDNVEYVPPSPLESPAQTKSRRGKLQGQISRLEKARGSQKEYRDTWIYDLLKRTDKSREDVTPLLLEKFDIHNVKRSDVCCAFDLTRTDRKIRQIRSQYVRNNGQYYSAAVEECYLQHSARFRESLRSIQRLYRKELDYEDSGEMKRTLNNECSGWFCTEIGQHGTHFVSGYLDREQSEKHCVAKKILDQINISGADLRSIVNASKAVGNMKRTVNVFEIKEEVFVDPSSRKRQQNYWIDIEDIACIEHGQIDICEKEDDGGMPRVDVTPLLLKEFGMETVTKDIPLLRARTEWREVYSVCLETKRIIQIAEQAARDEQSLLESLILLLKQAKEEGQHAEGSLVQAFQDEKRRADRKIKKLGDQITSLENVNGFSGMTYTNTKERVVKGVVGQMNVTMDKLRSIRNMCEIAESKASDEHTSRESLMLLLEQAKEGQQAEGFLAQALQDEKHSAEKSSQELSFKLRDLEKELTERSVDKGVVEKINITGEKLRGIANEFTGAVEGLKMKRTLNIAGPYSHENRVDLHSQKFRQKCYVDIEDITDIKDGVVGLDWREEKKSVSITAEGGSRTFGCQRIHEAKYWGDPDENLHRFHVSLEQTSRRCKPNELLSCEVRTNKESRFLSRLDQSRWLKYRIYRDGDGLLYKEVEHTWFNCFWYDELSLYVKIGPLPDDLECAETEFIDIDPERVQTAFQDAYAPLFSESTNTMNIVFAALVFEENIMKKGGLLHHIALTKLSVTSPTLTTSMSDSDSESNLDSSSDEEENRTQKCAAEEENRTQKCAHCQEVFDAYYVAIQHEIQCAHEANYKKVTGNETLSNNAAIDDSDHSERGYADFLDLFRESDVGEFDPIFAEDDHEERDEFHIDCEVVDDEATIESEENLGRDISYKDEIDLLNRENRVSIEEILALYASRSPVDYCSEEQHLNATRIQAVWRSFQIRNTKKPK